MSLSRRLAGATALRRRWREAGVARIAVALGVLLTLWQEASTYLVLGDPKTARVAWSVGVPYPGAELAWALLAVSGILATLFLVGYRTRWSGALLCLGLSVLLFSDRQLYSNHLYLLILGVGLLSLADSGRSLGFDGRQAEEAGGDPGAAGTVIVWPLRLLMGQISLVYLFAALAKLNPEYLSGAVLGSLLAGRLGGFEAVAGLGTELAIVAAVAAVVEAGLAVALWSRRHRITAALVGGALHLGIVLLIIDRGIVAFTLATVGVYPLFLTRETDSGRGHKGCTSSLYGYLSADSVEGGDP